MRISFVIPTFNCAAFLPHAVRSCQEQTYKDIEIIIVDDCSTDTTSDYIRWLLKQGDKRIIHVRNETNKGRSFSRNIGNSIATGEVICVLDSDDLAISDRATWTAKKMKKCQVCYGSALVMDAIGIKLGVLPAGPIDMTNTIKPIEDLEKNLKAGIIETRENKIVHSTMAYTKEIALKYPYSGGVVSDLGIDDWEMQVRMIKDGVKFDYIPDEISAYRLLTNGISKTRNPIEVMKVKAGILEGMKCPA